MTSHLASLDALYCEEVLQKGATPERALNIVAEHTRRVNTLKDDSDRGSSGIVASSVFRWENHGRADAAESPSRRLVRCLGMVQDVSTDLMMMHSPAGAPPFEWLLSLSTSSAPSLAGGTGESTSASEAGHGLPELLVDAQLAYIVPIPGSWMLYATDRQSSRGGGEQSDGSGPSPVAPQSERSHGGGLKRSRVAEGPTVVVDSSSSGIFGPLGQHPASPQSSASPKHVGRHDDRRPVVSCGSFDDGSVASRLQLPHRPLCPSLLRGCLALVSHAAITKPRENGSGAHREDVDPHGMTAEPVLRVMDVVELLGFVVSDDVWSALEGTTTDGGDADHHEGFGGGLDGDTLGFSHQFGYRFEGLPTGLVSRMVAVSATRVVLDDEVRLESPPGAPSFFTISPPSLETHLPGLTGRGSIAAASSPVALVRWRDRTVAYLAAELLGCVAAASWSPTHHIDVTSGLTLAYRDMMSLFGGGGGGGGVRGLADASAAAAGGHVMVQPAWPREAEEQLTCLLVTAELVLLWLTSSVVGRSEATSAGDLSLRIELPVDTVRVSHFCELFAALLRQLQPSCVVIRPDDAQTWAPTMDYQANGISASPLQLPQGCIVVCADESPVLPGSTWRPATVGGRAASSRWSLHDVVSSMMLRQVVPVDLGGWSIDVPTDVRFLVVSSAPRCGPSGQEEGVASSTFPPCMLSASLSSVVTGHFMPDHRGSNRKEDDASTYAAAGTPSPAAESASNSNSEPLAGGPDVATERRLRVDDARVDEASCFIRYCRSTAATVCHPPNGDSATAEGAPSLRPASTGDVLRASTREAVAFEAATLRFAHRRDDHRRGTAPAGSDRWRDPSVFVDTTSTELMSALIEVPSVKGRSAAGGRHNADRGLLVHNSRCNRRLSMLRSMATSFGRASRPALSDWGRCLALETFL